MLTAFSILLAATTAAPEKNPSAEIVEALHAGTGGGSCVMFTNGACVCSDYQAYVRDLNCSETETANERICSYNLAMSDTAGFDAPYAYQYMDVMRLGDDGQWSIVRAYAPAVAIPYFDRSS
jgi:hypothetical protein